MTDRELENLGMVCTLTSLEFTGEEIRVYQMWDDSRLYRR